MKAKLLSLIGAIAVMTMVMAGSVLADVTVHGIVKQADGTTDAGSGILVDVSCDNGADVTDTQGTTDSNSEYQVTFNSSTCGLGSTVTGSVPGSEVNKTVTQNDAVIGLDNLYLVDINLSVPEFSAIAASVALMGASAGYIALRKRK